MPSQLRKEQSSASVDEIIVIVSRQTSWKRIRESYVSNELNIIKKYKPQRTQTNLFQPPQSSTP